MEHPVERITSNKKCKEPKTYTGWVDYWCRYKDFDYFIEVKYDRHDLKKKNDQNSHKNWSYMHNTQLNNIKDEAKRFGEFTKRGVILLSFQIVVFYKDTDKNSHIKPVKDKDEFLEIQNYYTNSLSPKPTWSGFWLLHKNLVENSKDEFEKCDTIYPGVLILSKFEHVSKA